MRNARSFVLCHSTLPRHESRVIVPPLKCQGIKTRLAPFIMSSVRWEGRGRWIEPFLGSGVVLFNVAPARAHVADTNPHIIGFYRDIAVGSVTPALVREFLEDEGRRLLQRGEEHYYAVRERFNRRPASLDFLFLNRSCFNGLMRFNRGGHFNVPWGRKPDRFRGAYVTKIVNQVARVQALLRERDWTFQVASWETTLAAATRDDFVYADPPYAGRHTDYYNGWTEADAEALFRGVRALPCGFALSTWKQNRHRVNPLLLADLEDADVVMKTHDHFYHVGPTADHRNAMEEALIIRSGVEVKGEYAANRGGSAAD